MFDAASPVWPQGRETEMNLTVGFRAEFTVRAGEKVQFRATASSIYRLFINEKMAAYGPARAAHGYFRVDDLDVTEFVRDGVNVAVIEATGYNCNSFYCLDQPSFLQAEILVADCVVAATGKKEFAARILPERLQQVQRYSYQRSFVECYDFHSGKGAWETHLETDLSQEKLTVQSQKQLLPRGIPAYSFGQFQPTSIVSSGKATLADKPYSSYHPRYLEVEAHGLKGFPYSVLPSCLNDEVLSIHTREEQRNQAFPSSLCLREDSYQTIDFGQVKTGFIGFRISCTKPVTIYLTFDEILSEGDVNPVRLDTCNAIRCTFEPGSYTFLSMEPYTLRYLKFVAFGASCVVDTLHLFTYETPASIRAVFSSGDEVINSIFKAGVETFRQSAMDVFMDNPSRERAGWLCDSFFSARVEKALSNNSDIERNFLENYLLAPVSDNLPAGMLPMCYPSDCLENLFIPNWPLWLVLELGEYFVRTGDRNMVDRFKEKIYALFNWFESFRNSAGLLEKLEGWIFVEWSEAACFVQDVNFPTNMLYAGALKTAAALYHDNRLKRQSEELLETVRSLSYRKDPVSGKMFFSDHAMRGEDGTLKVMDDFSEVCQYYAFFFGAASPETYPDLWNRLVKEFGPIRKNNGDYPSICFANAFIGNYLRLELLNQHGLRRQMLQEMKGYFSHMAELTGTLWEYDDLRASCCQGFASYVCYLLLRSQGNAEYVLE